MTMAEELRPCPFCGEVCTLRPIPGTDYKSAVCANLHGSAVNTYVWNSRPVEDALRVEIASREARRQRGRAAWRELYFSGCIAPWDGDSADLQRVLDEYFGFKNGEDDDE